MEGTLDESISRSTLDERHDDLMNLYIQKIPISALWFRELAAFPYNDRASERTIYS